MRQETYWATNVNLDLPYPHGTHTDENGCTVYHMPMRYMNKIPIDTSEGARQYEYTRLIFPDGMKLPVYWEETTDKLTAYRNRAYMNSYHTDERQYKKHYLSIMNEEIDGISDGNQRVGENHKSSFAYAREVKEDEGVLANEEQAVILDFECGTRPLPDFEKQLMDRETIQEIMDLANAENPLYWKVFELVKVYHYTLEEAGKMLGWNKQKVSRCMCKFQEIARAYRAKNP